MKYKKYFKFYFSKGFLFVIIFFIFMTLLMKYSILTRLDNILSGDELIYVYCIHFYKESLSKLEFPLQITKIYYPGGWGPLQVEFPLTYFFLSGLTASFTRLSEAAILNIFHLALVFLSGISMYILLYFLTRDKYSSLVGGFVYLSTPYLLMPVGWVGLTQLFWIPLIFLYIEKLLQNPNIENSILLGFLCSMQFFNVQEYTLYLTVMLPVYIFSKIIFFKKFRNKKLVKSIILSLIIILVLSGWYMIYFLTGEYEIRDINTNMEFSLFNKTAKLPNSFALILSIIGCFLIFKIKLKKFYPLLIVGVLGLLFALGPFSDFAPHTFLYKYWPYFNAFRTPFRMFVFTFLLISISITVLFNLIYKKSKTLFVVFLVVLIIYSFFSNIQRDNYFRLSLEEEKMYKNISLESGDFSITEYPNIEYDQYVYHILFHEKNLVGGVGPPPNIHKDFLNICGIEILNVSNEPCRKRLEELDVRYVIYHSEEYTDWNITLNDIKNSKYLNLIGKYDKAYLFKLNI